MDTVSYTPMSLRVPIPRGVPIPLSPPIGPIGISLSLARKLFPEGIKITENGPHYYAPKRNWVGRVSDGVTADAVYEALRHHAAPLQQRRISQDGDTTNISFGGIGGAVEHFIFPEHRTIVNTTMPGHIFHPGNVFRRVVQDGDDLYIETTGFGVGFFPRENEEMSSPLWEWVDKDIRKRLNPHDVLNTTAPEMHGASGDTFKVARETQTETPASTQAIEPTLTPSASFAERWDALPSDVAPAIP